VDSLTLRYEAFLNTFAYISGDSNQIFIKILLHYVGLTADKEWTSSIYVGTYLDQDFGHSTHS